MLGQKAWIGIAGIIIGVLWLFHSYIFMRHPKRNIPSGKVIIAPANGKISKIIRTNKNNHQIKKGFLGKIKLQSADIAQDCYFINIVMNIFNVHYQKAPYDGKILYTKHLPGSLMNAVNNSLKPTLENEHTEILMKTQLGNIKIIQIAGFVARRIHTFVSKGQNIKKGEDLGIIKLGSQVTLIIPAKLKLMVKEGQTVIDGETIIAKP